jgi:hypothetical protein
MGWARRQADDLAAWCFVQFGADADNAGLAGDAADPDQAIKGYVRIEMRLPEKSVAPPEDNRRHESRCGPETVSRVMKVL